MISEAEFRQNLELLQEQLANACGSANRSIEEVQILPVTKNWPIEAVHYAQRAGFSRVGENRVQEAIEKQVGIEGINWDLLGICRVIKPSWLPVDFLGFKRWIRAKF